MTAYFDTFASEVDKAVRLDAAAPQEERQWERLAELEERIVREVTLAVELPGFPADLRLAAHRAMVVHGVTTQPQSCFPAWADISDPLELAEHLRRMGSDLHTVFHALSRREIGETDDPTARAREYLSAGEDARLAIIRACGVGGDPRATVVVLPRSFAPPAAAPAFRVVCARCHGRKTIETSCSMCGDSTFDHECDDTSVPCPECATTGGA